MVKPQTLKGFRDFLPEEMAIRQKVINTLKEVFSSYGFEPLETPALEYASTLLGKYGEEADKLLYQFKDRGGREVGLRYDLTVPLARVIASNPNLPLPFKRYQIQPVWRADKPQAGRYREFLQCDADIVGDDSVTSDLEILSCADMALRKLGFKNFTISINSRKVFGKANPKIITILDKEDKLEKKELLRQLAKVIGSAKKAEAFYLSLKKMKPEGRLKEILEQGKKLNLSFDPFLARGLDYYTDLIFEVKIDQYQGGSLGGGGRYDNLIGMFLGKDVPAVGFSFGIDRLIEAGKQQGLFKNLPKTSTQILVTAFSPQLLDKSIQLASQLRTAGINTDLYPDPEVKLDKQLKYADRKGIPLVVIIGPEEAKKKTLILRDMKAKSQEEVTPKQLLEKLS